MRDLSAAILSELRDGPLAAPTLATRLDSHTATVLDALYPLLRAGRVVRRGVGFVAREGA